MRFRNIDTESAVVRVPLFNGCSTESHHEQQARPPFARDRCNDRRAPARILHRPHRLRLARSSRPPSGIEALLRSRHLHAELPIR